MLCSIIVIVSRLKRRDGAAHYGVLGNDVVGLASVYLGDADDGSIDRSDIA